MIIKINKDKWVFILGALLFSALIVKNIILVLYGCLNANDFSIYQQAIYGFWTQETLNPFSYARGANILNDHFDPIIWLAGIWVGVFGRSSVNLILFEALMVMGTLLLPMLLGRTTREKILGIFLLVFCRALLQGLEFPIHTTTWSAIPAWLFGYFLYNRNFKYAAICLITLPFFREIYPFMIIGFSFWLYLIGEKSKSIGLFFFALFWIAFVTYGRPYFLGATASYHGEFVSGFQTDPFGEIWRIISRPAIQWNMFAQYLPLLGILVFKRNINFKSSFVGLLFFILPAISIHVVIGRMVHHHGIPMVLPLIGFLTFAMSEIHFKKKWILYVLLLPIFFTSTSRYQRAITYILKNDNKCAVNSTKLTAISELEHFIKSNIKENEKIIASGDVVPLASDLHVYVYQVFPAARPEPFYDYIILGKPGAGDPWPLKAEQLNEWYDRCSKVGETLLDNSYYYVLKGKFDTSCIGFKDVWALEKESVFKIN